MPILPVFDAPQATQATPIPRADPEAMGQAAQAIARGAAQFQDEASTWADRMAQAQRAVGASDAMVGAQLKIRQMAQQRARSAGTIDAKGNIIGTDQAVNGFADDAAGLRTQTLAGIADPLTKQMVAENFDHAMMGAADDVRDQGYQLERQARMGKLQLDNNALAQQASEMEEGSLQQRQVLTTAQSAINTLRDAGFISGSEAAQEQIRFGSNVQKAKALQFIRAGAEAADAGRLSPLAIGDYVADPRNFAGLLPDEREQLADQAVRLGGTIVRMRAAAQEHDDSLAERNLKAAQGVNEVILLDQIHQGGTVEESALLRLGQTQQISPAGFELLHNEIAKAQNGTDDVATVAHLYQGLAQQRDITADVLAAREQNRLSRTTTLDLLKAQSGRAQAGDKAVDQANFSALRTALGGTMAENGIEMPGEAAEARQQHLGLWAEAQQEWTRRVRIGGEDSNAVLNDMLTRYRRPDGGTVYPSRFGPIGTLDDAIAAKTKNEAAHAAGTISAADYANEKVVIAHATIALQQAAAAEAARKAAIAKGGAGARPLGLAPAGGGDE